MKKLDNKTIENAFDDIKLICDNAQFDEEFSIYEEYLEQFDIVEDALNELHERREMMQRFNEASVPSVIDDDTYKKLQTTLTYSDVQSLILTRDKYEQALKIIKEKRVDARALIEIFEDEWTWEQYMDEEDDINTGGHQFSRDRLTQEEYELLKEVLL